MTLGTSARATSGEQSLVEKSLGLEGVNQSTKAWGSEKHTELAGFSRNTDRVFVKGTPLLP